MSGEESFRSLEEVHRGLGQLFTDHQVALIELDLGRAGRILGRFDQAVRAHIRHEEEALLPVYETRVKFSRVGDPETLRDEHRKIERHVAEFRDRVSRLDGQDPTIRRTILALIDDQYRFKQLLEHHNERESRTLYPLLDEVSSPEERRRMLAMGREGS